MLRDSSFASLVLTVLSCKRHSLMVLLAQWYYKLAAGLCSTAALSIACYQVYSPPIHFRHCNSPSLQRLNAKKQRPRLVITQAVWPFFIKRFRLSVWVWYNKLKSHFCKSHASMQICPSLDLGHDKQHTTVQTYQQACKHKAYTCSNDYHSFLLTFADIPSFATLYIASVSGIAFTILAETTKYESRNPLFISWFNVHSSLFPATPMMKLTFLAKHCLVALWGMQCTKLNRHWLVLWVMQRYIIRIVFMVPLYAVMSFLSLLLPHESIYFDSIRDWWGLVPFAKPKRIASCHNLEGPCYSEITCSPPSMLWFDLSALLHVAPRLCKGLVNRGSIDLTLVQVRQVLSEVFCMQLRGIRDLQLPVPLLSLCRRPWVCRSEDERVSVGALLALLDMLFAGHTCQRQICEAVQAGSATVRAHQATAGHLANSAVHPGKVSRRAVATQRRARDPSPFVKS